MSTPPLYSPVFRRSPAYRLRSKRSRLRLRNKERESDTDISQEKERDRSGDSICEKVDTEIKEAGECTDNKNSLKGVRKYGKMEYKDCEKKKESEMSSAEREKNQDRPIGKRKVGKIANPSQELENNGKKVGHCVLNSSMSQLDYKLPMDSSEENQIVHCSQEKVNVEQKSHSGSAVSIQTEGVQITENSQEMLEQANQLPKDSNKGYDDRINIKQSGVLDSCTLVEGLLFPVEYYIRTTRRMAASHSSVDLDAVIYSQLTGGRGRRRLSQSQTSGRGHMTPNSICSSTDQTRRRGKGQRGRRGRPRSTASCAKADPDCTISHPPSDSQAVSESPTESKSTSQTESTSQSVLVLERLEAGSQEVHSPGPTVSLKPSPEQGVTQDFKHLPDSQLCFDSQLLPDSSLYPIFRRKHDQTGKASQTGTNKDAIFILFSFCLVCNFK